MAFDELPPFHCQPAELIKSLQRTHRWELRSLARHLDAPQEQALYSVIHGGTDLSLRSQSAAELGREPFDGHAIGGSLGKCTDDVVSVVAHTAPLFPEDKPIHLLGIAHELGIEACVPHGVDTFDSCYPSRIARHGTLLTSNRYSIALGS